MITPPRLQLPDAAPEIVFGDVGGNDFLPFALYSLVEVSESALSDLAKVLERDKLVSEEPDTIHLVRVAPTSIFRQDSLTDVLTRHIEYGKQHRDPLQYYPFGFLVAHDADWETNGVYLVYADFEKPYAVTAFRMKISDVPEVCWDVREDDEGIELLKDRFELKDDQHA